MSNLLLDEAVKTKIEGLIGTAPSDILLNVVNARIEGLLGYPLAAASYKDILDGTDSDVINPTRTPITSITSIKINGDVEDVNDFEIVDNKQIRWTNGVFIARALPQIDTFATYPGHSIEVEYTAGYASAADLPDNLIYLVSIMYNQAAFNLSSKNNLSSYKIADIAYSFKDSDKIDSQINDLMFEVFG